MAKYTLLSYKYIPYNGFLTDDPTPLIWELKFRIIKFWGWYDKVKTIRFRKYSEYYPMTVKSETEKYLDKKINKTFNYYLHNKV